MCLLQGSNVLKMAFERAYGKYRLCLSMVRAFYDMMIFY